VKCHTHMSDAACVCHGILDDSHVVQQCDVRGELHIPYQVLLAPVPACVPKCGRPGAAAAAAAVREARTNVGS
jgi:hypothetical protein